MHRFSGKSALITGASAGLGEEFALQLAALGATHLILTARRAERLEELKKRLVATFPALHVETMPGDLSLAADVSALMKALEAKAFTPDILINNAGVGDLGVFRTSDPARIEAMLSLNIIALTRLTRWALPPMLEKRSGWICNVGSVGGIVPLPTFAVYAASKAYVNSLTEAVRVEVRGQGVRVMALCPGPVETEFVQAATRAKGKKNRFSQPSFFWVDKKTVVRQALQAMARGQGRLIPGLRVRLPMLFAESFPRWLMRFLFNVGVDNFGRKAK